MKERETKTGHWKQPNRRSILSELQAVSIAREQSVQDVK